MKKQFTFTTETAKKFKAISDLMDGKDGGSSANPNINRDEWEWCLDLLKNIGVEISESDWQNWGFKNKAHFLENPNLGKTHIVSGSIQGAVAGHQLASALNKTSDVKSESIKVDILQPLNQLTEIVDQLLAESKNPQLDILMSELKNNLKDLKSKNDDNN